MALHPCSTRYTTGAYSPAHHRATPSTHPGSDEQHKDQELSCRPSHKKPRHQSVQGRERDLSVLPAPPGGAQDSLDLRTKSSRELQSNVGEKGLEECVKDFLRVKPAEFLVTIDTVLLCWDYLTDNHHL